MRIPRQPTVLVIALAILACACEQAAPVVVAGALDGGSAPELTTSDSESPDGGPEGGDVGDISDSTADSPTMTQPDAPDAPQPSDIDGGPASEPDEAVAADVLTDCPATYAETKGKTCADGLKCEFGKECCCGACAPELVCWCNNGAFSCTYSDFCMGPQCSPGCPLNEYATPKGCKSCQTIGKDLPEAVSQTLAAWTACSNDADCATTSLVKYCGAECYFGAAKTTADQAHIAVWAAASQYCGGGFGCYLPCPQHGKPVCHMGHCRLAQPCDPQVYAIGAPCDDGNACTVGDACQAANQCKGKPKGCDDNNPCTTDTCLPASGCAHTNHSLACPATTPCGLGGQCKGGVCIDSGVSGWKLPLPPPLPKTSGGVARLSGGSVVAVHGDQKGTTNRALRSTAQGAIVWDKLGLVTGEVSDVAADANDGFLVAYRIFGSWPTGKAVVARFDAGGAASWATEITLPQAANVRLRSAPDGSWVVSGSQNKNPDNTWQAWVARLDAGGKLSTPTDLGAVPDYGMLIHAAAQGKAIAVLTTTSGTKIPSGDQSDLRFVRLDEFGKVTSDAIVLADPTYDRAFGLVAVPGGWLGAAQSTAYAKDSKSLGGWLLRFDLDGKLLWSKSSSTAVPWVLKPNGATALLVELSVPQLVEYTFRSVDADGVKAAPLTVPTTLLGTGGLHVAAAGADGVYVLSSQSAGAQLVRLTPPGCP